MKEKNQAKIDQLLQRYLDGQTTPAEDQLISNWYEQLEKNGTAQNLNLSGLNNQLDQGWLALQDKLAGAGDPVQFPDLSENQANRFTFKWPLIWSSVAAVFLLAFGLLFFRQDIFNPGNAPVISFLEEQNNSLKPLRLSLSDGSTIWLDPGAYVRYPATFSRHRRDVILKGNAFFEISRDPGRPFRVYSKTMVVKVLGTSFTVKAATAGKAEEVLVRTGKVSVFPQPKALETDLAKSMQDASETKGIVLTADQKVVVAKAGAKVEKGTVAPAYWENLIRPSYLVFENASLATVTDRLSADYKMTIKLVNPQLNHCTLTASLGDQPLETKLEMICKSINATFEVKGDLILINGPGCE